MATAPQINPADTEFTLDSLHEVRQITTDLNALIRRLASEKVASEGRIVVTVADVLDVAPAALAETAREVGTGSDS